MVDFQRRMGRWLDERSLLCFIHLVLFVLDRLTNECEALKERLRELNAVIGELFQGSEEDLKLSISNFQRDQDQKKREVQDVREICPSIAIASMRDSF